MNPIVATAPTSLRPIDRHDPVGITNLAARWGASDAEAARPFFITWSWLGSWLASLPVEREVFAFQSQSGSALLGAADHRRHWIVREQALSLNASGVPLLDQVAIEHNNLVRSPGLSTEKPAENQAEQFEGLRELIRSFAASARFNTLYLPGMDEALFEAIEQAAARERLRCESIDERPYYWVDLAKIGPTRADFLGSLSQNTRYQVNRAIKAVESVAGGPVIATEARTAGEAIDWFRLMRPLHEARWNDKDRTSAFDNPMFEPFHLRLIESSFAAGCVQMLRFSAGEDVLGYLYNFVNGKTVYTYNGGFRQAMNSKDKPGVIGHLLAIEHNRARGHSTYDFLAGYSQHKASLATNQGLMRWYRVEKPRLALRVEQILMWVADRLRGPTKPATPATPIVATEKDAANLTVNT